MLFMKSLRGQTIEYSQGAAGLVIYHKIGWSPSLQVTRELENPVEEATGIGIADQIYDYINEINYETNAT